jgi:hypothetical protein
MNVLRHNHIAENMEDIPPAHLLQRALEQVAGRRRGKLRQPVVTTEGEKVNIPRMLKTYKPGWHNKWSLIPP